MGLWTDVLSFIRERKAWWLVPVLVIIIAFGVFVVALSQSSVLSPFIYALF